MAATGNTDTTTAATTTTGVGLTGCVKWFDNGLNYGFITVLTEGEHKNVDIFVHQSNIRTTRDCFRTLYTGECVAFELTQSNNEKHPYHAINVSGYNGTLLHCENPNYRPRGGNRGRGRGQFRGGRGQVSRGQFREGRGQGSRGNQTTEHAQNQEATQQVPESASAPVSTPTSVSVQSDVSSAAPTPAHTTGEPKKGGRGRKPKQA